MEISEERIGYVCIPRFALAKRIFILWLFEFAGCLVGSGLFLIFSVFFCFRPFFGASFGFF